MVDRPADDPQKLPNPNSPLTPEEDAELASIKQKNENNSHSLTPQERLRDWELVAIQRGNLTREEAAEQARLTDKKSKDRDIDEQTRLGELEFTNLSGERGLAIIYGQVWGKKWTEQEMTPEEDHAATRLSNIMLDAAYTKGFIDHNQAEGLLITLMKGKDKAHLNEQELHEEFMRNYLKDKNIDTTKDPCTAEHAMAALYARLMYKYIITGELTSVERLALEDLAFECLHVKQYEDSHDLGSAIDAIRSRAEEIRPPVAES